MRRMLAVLVALCVFTPPARAQDRRVTVPRVMAPVSFALDTTLFRLTKADVPVSRLIFAPARERPGGYRIYGMSPQSVARMIAARCPRTNANTQPGINVVPGLRSDGTWVLEIGSLDQLCGGVTRIVAAPRLPR